MTGIKRFFTYILVLTFLCPQGFLFAAPNTAGVKAQVVQAKRVVKQVAQRVRGMVAPGRLPGMPSLRGGFLPRLPGVNVPRSPQV